MAPCSILPTSLSLFLTLFVGLHIHGSIAATSSSQGYVYALCPDMTSVAPDSPYQANINTILSYLSSNSSNKNLIYNATVGSGANKIYGLFFCRIDVTVEACQKCVSFGIKALTTSCPGKKVSIVWYFDQCVVRYSNVSFLGTMHDHPMIPMWNRENTHDPWSVTSNTTGFMEVVLDTLGEAADTASSGPRSRKFATKEATFQANLTELNTIYALTECTPDISLADCKSCLNSVIGNTTELCNVKTGCTVMCPNCNMRYDIYPFYGPDADSSGIYPDHPSKGKDTRRRWAVLIGAIAAAALSVLLVLCISILVRNRNSKKSLNDENDIEDMESLKFDFSTVRAATNSFSEDRKLGEGGFGPVFKGKLESGQEIAVKRLSRTSTQGTEELKTEVLLVAKLQHRNLVKLLGYCVSKTEKLLVYEFCSNLSLDRFLSDPTNCASLDWQTRYKIICGIAKGLLYLHEDSRLKIIHRDLKSSNVLLDNDMNPKISDFGMARLFGAGETQGNTNKVAGTFGYMAPEYVVAGQYSVKSDVYSFGIIVLEIVSGQRNKFCSQQLEEESLLYRAWRLWNEETAMELVDPIIKNSSSWEEVAKCIHIGLLCIQEDAARRPRMTSVVAALSGDAIVLPSPSAPHFFLDGINESDLEAFTGSKNITAIDPR